MLEKYIVDKRLQEAAEWAICLVIGFLLYLILNRFVFGMANISGNSMEPTLSHGDKVVMNKFIYMVSEPKKDDIIAFPYKGNPDESYVKRIVGMPGDIIEVIDGRFAVNGDVLESFSEEILDSQGDLNYPFVVPSGSFFVLGDNRNHSSDSRNSSVGCIPKEKIIGRVNLRVLPISKLGSINKKG